MAKCIDKPCPGNAQISSLLQDDERKEQTEEFQEMQEGNYRYLLIENSYGGELLRKMRTSLSHLINPENVLLCIPKYDSRVLARRDFQEIRCVTERKGDIAGAEFLLDHLERYRGWLPCLLKVLRDPMVLQDYVADDIEKTIEILQEERKKQASVVQERADGTYMTDLHKISSTFGAGEPTRGHKIRVTRTVSESVLGQSHNQPLLHRISHEETTIMDPSLYTNETMRRPISSPPLALTEDTLRKLGPPATETSTDTETKIKKASFDLPHGFAGATVSDDPSGNIFTQRSEEPVSDHIPSTSRETQEEGTASEYTYDICSADGYAVGKAMLRQRSTGENKRQIDVLLVGKSGNGKSSTGNSILLWEAFESSDDVNSCTKNTQFDYSEVSGVIFKVVDGPGLGDTNLNREEAFNLVLNSMESAISMNAEGYHAILVVLRYGVRFTEEDVTTLENMKAIFGQGFIKDHAILVMTHGDVFNKKAKKGKYTFEEWCEKQDGIFKRLLYEVENRIVLFDNTAEDKRTLVKQQRKLMEVIDSLSSGGKRYNHEMFEKAKKLRDLQAIVESEKPFLQESALREAALISQRFHEINFDHVEETYEIQKSLLERTQKLIERIKEQDRNTGVLKVSMTFANNLKKSLEIEMESVRNINALTEGLSKQTERDKSKQNEFGDIGKPEEEELEWVPDWEQFNKNKYLQKQDEAMSVRQMAHPEVIAPEQHIRKGQKLTQAGTISLHKQEDKRAELWKEKRRAANLRKPQGYEVPTQLRISKSPEQRSKIPEHREQLELLQGEHTKNAEEIVELYKCMKKDTTPFFTKLRKSVRKIFSSTRWRAGDRF